MSTQGGNRHARAGTRSTYHRITRLGCNWFREVPGKPQWHQQITVLHAMSCPKATSLNTPTFTMARTYHGAQTTLIADHHIPTPRDLLGSVGTYGSVISNVVHLRGLLLAPTPRQNKSVPV